MPDHHGERGASGKRHSSGGIILPAHAEEQAAHAEVEALLTATAHLSAQAEPESVLRTLVEQAAQLFQADRAVYAVRRDDRIVIPADWESGAWVEDERDAVLTGIVRLVWQSGCPHRSNDVAADPNLVDAHVERYRLRSQLAVPLLSPTGERLGIVSLDNCRRPGGFSARDERLLAAICQTGAAVLVRANEAAARLEAERAALQSKREVEALLAAADQLNRTIEPQEVLLRVVTIAVELLDVERGGIVTDEGDYLRLRHVWVDGIWRAGDRVLDRETSIAGRVIRERRTVRADALRQMAPGFVSSSSKGRPTTALGVPIVTGDGRLLGALQLFDRRDGRPFSGDDERLAEGIAHHAAVALERCAQTDVLLQSERRFSALLQHVSDVIAILDADGAVRYESPSLERIAGYRPDEIVGRRATAHVHPEDLDRVQRYFARVARIPGLHDAVEFRFRHHDGSWLHIESVANNLLDDPSVRGIVMTSRDVTERKQLEEHFRHQAVTDALTGLPNRSLFFDRLLHALEVSRRRQRGLAVLFLDLDGFKAVNDTLGHAAGDELLREVGARLLACQRAGDTVARFGGDEFAVLLEDLGDRRDAARVADRILLELRRPFNALRAAAVPIGGSIGIAFHAGLAARVSGDDLVRQADSAMYLAKAIGNGRAFFNGPDGGSPPDRVAEPQPELLPATE